METFYRKLELIEESLKRLSEISKTNTSLEKFRKSWRDKDSTERNLQKIIEAIIDIGKMLVSRKKLREPGNNREVFLILEEQGLFPSKYMTLIDKMIGMRNIIVHSYDRIDDAVVYGVLKKNIADIKKLVLFFKKNYLTTQDKNNH